MTPPPAHTPEAFIQRIAACVDRHDLLAADAAVLVAVSGGADSVALLHALAALAADPDRRYRLHVGHLDHALREDAAEDSRFVADLVAGLGLPVICERIDVAAAARPGEGLEAAARRVRYDFLGRAAETAGCEFIATAHHADDNVETVLHRILRGTGIDGLAGIRPFRPLADGGGPCLIRPMLDVTRSDVEAFLADRGLAWRTDHTNADTRHMRNRIRRELLPMLRERFNPQTDAAIGRLIQAASWAETTLDRIAAEALAAATVESGPDSVVLAVDSLRALGPAGASQVIRAALGHAAAPMQRIGMEHIERVWDLIAQPSGTGQLHLPDGVRVDRQYDRLVTRTAPDAAAAAPDGACPVAWPGRTDLPDGSVLEVTVRDGGPADLDDFIAGKDRFDEMLDVDHITPPVAARRWAEGDRFTPLGAPGAARCSDFFGSARIPADQRCRAWIITDAAGIVWVAPHRIDHRVRIRDATTHIAHLRLCAP